MRSTVLALALLVLLGAPTAEAARSPFAGSTPRIDALRLPAGAMLQGHDGAHTLLLATEVDGARWTYATYDLRTRRTTPIALPGSQCSVVIGSGSLAAACGNWHTGNPPWRVFARPVAGGDWAPVPIPATFGVGASERFDLTDVGRHWVAISYGGYHSSGVGYVSRTDPTAAVVGDSELGVDRVPDLDAVAGSAPLCAPLHRPWVLDEISLRDVPGRYQYAKPWGLTVVDDTMRLQHCGTRRATTLCPTWCIAELAGHRVAWTDGPRLGRRVRIRDLRSGRTTAVTVRHRWLSARLVGDDTVVELRTRRDDPVPFAYGLVRR
jgi:hypothetical protein